MASALCQAKVVVAAPVAAVSAVKSAKAARNGMTGRKASPVGACSLKGMPLSGKTSIKASRQQAAVRVQTVASAATYAGQAASLAAEFGIANKVTVELGPGGLPLIKMWHPNGSVAEAYLYGACVTSWKLPGGHDLLYCRPDAKFDGSKPISGGVPHCFPQFGPGKMQQHGFARNMNWKLTASGVTADGAPWIEMVLSDCGFTHGMWDAAFSAVYKVTLGADHLVCHMSVINMDSRPISFTAALHTYFAANISGVEVWGLQGASLLNKIPDANNPTGGTESREAVRIAGPVDTIYLDTTKPITLNSGKGQMIGIENQGWKDTVVWSPWTSMENCYREFVCVESAKAVSPVTVAPLEQWDSQMTLKALGAPPAPSA
eukprot:jgi/Mesvir1/21723/Mv04135-RA.1